MKKFTYHVEDKRHTSDSFSPNGLDRVSLRRLDQALKEISLSKIDADQEKDVFKEVEYWLKKVLTDSLNTSETIEPIRTT